MMTKTFKGASVYLSRSLVPEEIYDSLHDAVKLNGAQVFLCSNSSMNGPDDYHIISSKDHVKFSDLYDKGCNLLGPQCVLTCAKEHRMLPKQRFTCCLAMDGVNVLISGFDTKEKDVIEKMVTEMGGVLQTRVSSDVSFVIVKNVLAGKYKWALNTAKKPIVTLNWLYQCWKEHRVVPQESFRVLPFSGLTICVTKISGDERKEMQTIITQNGGKYSAELTRKCTHLVCDVPGGDKYKVAKKWGHIHIVSKRWVDHSVSRKACLDEESYPVQTTSTSSMNTKKKSFTTQFSQETSENSQSAPASLGTDPDFQTGLHNGISERDLETSQSQKMSSAYSDIPELLKDDETGVEKQKENETHVDGSVADDSQSDENDLYLADCKILLVGFEASEMRKLVNMVRRGGGSRYMEFNEKLTHVVVGSPSESEKKEVRGLAALGIINVVKKIWLADCDCEKKEIPVLSRHIASDLLFPKDTKSYNKGAMLSTKEVKSHNFQSIPPNEELQRTINSGASVLSDKVKEPERDNNNDNNNNSTKSQKKKSSVFLGRRFCFANSFPEDQKPEIINWINEGGGEYVADHTVRNVDFTVGLHGTIISPHNLSSSTFVSSHWIKSCLESGNLLDPSSHIIYTPLQCKIKLPGFDKFHLCVSQYEEKDRLLLRNLCFTLGAKFGEKLNKNKVTHLLCKFTGGVKYEAACKWGIQPVTSDWLLECVKQNKVVDVGPFYPKEVTVEDQEAGHCTTSQYPTQAVRMSYSEDASQLPTQSNNTRNNVYSGSKNDFREVKEYSKSCSKKPRLVEDERLINNPILDNTFENKITSDAGDIFSAVPDVAAAIEDLLQQTSKIHEKSASRNGCDESIFSSTCPVLVQDRTDTQPGFGLSKQWINRTSKKDEERTTPARDINAGIYDGFSETQTESQVVGYEEDLSGRQMIIDRVRTRSTLP